jgi:hypothetical protein
VRVALRIEALVQVELVGMTIIADSQVQVAIAVIIPPGHAVGVVKLKRKPVTDSV